MRIVKLTDETKNNILENLLKRSPNSYGKFEAAVGDILANGVYAYADPCGFNEI